MDQIALVNQQIDEGRKLLDALRTDGFEVSAACWMQAAEDEQWYLYFASPHVDKQGIGDAYRMVHTLIRGLPTPIGVDPFEVRLVTATDPLVVAINEVYRRNPAPVVKRIAAPNFGGRSIEGAFVYPPM